MKSKTEDCKLHETANGKRVHCKSAKSLERICAKENYYVSKTVIAKVQHKVRCLQEELELVLINIEGIQKGSKANLEIRKYITDMFSIGRDLTELQTMLIKEYVKELK
jgi:hypothetical protein